MCVRLCRAACLPHVLLSAPADLGMRKPGGEQHWPEVLELGHELAEPVGQRRDLPVRPREVGPVDVRPRELAIIELGNNETAAWFEAQRGRGDPVGVLLDHVARAADEGADPRVGGFVRAVGAVMSDAKVAEALARDEAVLREGLLPWVEAAQRVGAIRDDLPAGRLTDWIMVLLDGFLGRIAGERFAPVAERDMLLDTARRLIAP